MQTLQEIYDQLTPDLQQEMIDYAQSLLQQNSNSKKAKINFQWAGALRGYRNQYTSLELQKKAMQWWNE